jgi:hypothetical protein
MAEARGLAAADGCGRATHGSAKNDPLATVLSVVALVVIVLALPAVIAAGVVLAN